MIKFISSFVIMNLSINLLLLIIFNIKKLSRIILIERILQHILKRLSYFTV
jgi:hypothetical protein